MKKRLLFLGAPGAGKGTQAAEVSNTNKLVHLSTGDLLRKEVALKTDLGKQIDEIINTGELVNDSHVLEIVKKNILHASKGWILDGFPRNLIQAEALQRILFDINQKIDCVIYLQLQEEVLIERLLLRGRSDDNEQTIRKRLEVYRSKTLPLIDFYQKQKILHYIDGAKSVEMIFDEIIQLIG
tara:strand:- start:8609 stop:9157 length:549 start_codon:yes stop_codon:yes gene_type:complete